MSVPQVRLVTAVPVRSNPCNSRGEYTRIVTAVEAALHIINSCTDCALNQRGVSFDPTLFTRKRCRRSDRFTLVPCLIRVLRLFTGKLLGYTSRIISGV